ncbi:MAG: TlpA family protein disulfide reductase [Candidatus Nanopelagicales bacterium]
MSSRQEKERRRRERDRAQARAAQRRANIRFFSGVAAALAATGVAVVLILGAKSDGARAGLALTPVQERKAVAATADIPRVSSPDGKRALAGVKAQANEIIDDNIETRLKALEGVPVVVNQWAAWCPNCRAEFGFFQELAKGYDGKVAFLGLDSNDDRGDAESFLEDFPVPYPSIWDPGAIQARSIGAGIGWPTTVFYDAKGTRTFVRQGGYTTKESLDRDIRTYALG